jgi:hypothetical protein
MYALPEEDLIISEQFRNNASIITDEKPLSASYFNAKATEQLDAKKGSAF